MNRIFLTLSVSLICFSIYGQTIPNKTDTINRVDSYGKKQGLWIINNSILHREGYADTSMVEKGHYINSKKEGLWEEYFPNGIVKSKITYINNRPNGAATIYHENGNIKEQGIWENNRWVEEYSTYYSNGCLQRKCNWGALGDTIAIECYNYKKNSCDVVISIDTVLRKKTRVCHQQFSSYDSHHPDIIADTTEYLCFYNINKQITKEGQFSKKGQLLNGKAYFYDEYSILIRISIYKNGKYIGDEVIEK